MCIAVTSPICVILHFYSLLLAFLVFFSFIDQASPQIYTLSLHDALPILREQRALEHSRREVREVAEALFVQPHQREHVGRSLRSEEHTSELQSPCNLVCRLLLEKKK